MLVGRSRSTSRMRRPGHVRVRLRCWQRRRPGRLVVATLLVMLVAGLCAAAWLGRTAATPRSASSHARHATVAALLMAGATTVVYSLVVPPFEPPDELAHLQYARFVATTGTLPSAVPPPRLGVARRFVRVRAAAAVLRRRGSRAARDGPRIAGSGARPRSALPPAARRHRADDLPARRRAVSRDGTPGAPPAAARCRCSWRSARRG